MDESKELRRDDAGQGEVSPTGRDVARSVVVAVVGLVLMLPAVGVMPYLGQWMTQHGPFVVMLPFMLWMMLSGGLLGSGTSAVWRYARGSDDYR
nr:hypothetical protein [Corynebacterium lactis]